MIKLKTLKAGMAILALSLLAVWTSGLVYAQESLTPSNLAKGVIYHADGYQIKFESFIFGQDSHSYFDSKSKMEREIAADQVAKLGTVKGSYALEYGLGGAAAGLLGSLLGVKDAEKQVGIDVDEKNKATIVLGLTALSGVIGAVIGSTQRKYKTVYTNPNLDLESRLKIGVNWARDNKGLTIKYQF